MGTDKTVMATRSLLDRAAEEGEGAWGGHMVVADAEGRGRVRGVVTAAANSASTAGPRDVGCGDDAGCGDDEQK